MTHRHERRHDRGAPADAAPMELPPPALACVAHLRRSLTRYRSSGDHRDLEPALAAAAALLATLDDPADRRRPEVTHLRRLAQAIPEFGELLSVATAEAERAVGAGAARLWTGLGLRSASPVWTPEEREAARMVFAFACAARPVIGRDRIEAGLRPIGARRLAGLLCSELAADERVWIKALGDRYDSVRHRYAPRNAWRSLRLADLLSSDQGAQEAVTARLQAWIVAGGHPGHLASELEAALVHCRTPDKYA